LSFQNTCTSYICIIKDIKEKKNPLYLLLEWGKNAAETFFEKTLRTRLLFFMKIVEELELVLLILTVGNFKRFKSSK